MSEAILFSSGTSAAEAKIILKPLPSITAEADAERKDLARPRTHTKRQPLEPNHHRALCLLPQNPVERKDFPARTTSNHHLHQYYASVICLFILPFHSRRHVPVSITPRQR
jgi:hypothetical protein